MKKSIFTLFFIIISIFFCGCSQNNYLPEKIYEKNAIRIIREIEKNGQIKTTYCFGINSEEYKKFGLSEESLRVYKFYFASYINSLSKQYKDRSKENAEVSSCLYFSNIDAFGFSINFKNQTAQNEFYETSNSSSNNFVLERHFFINVYSLKTDFPISTPTAAQSFITPAKLALQETSKECDISQETLESCENYLNQTIFIYDFSSEGVEIKSKDVYSDGEKQHNFFAKNLNEIENEIEFYYATPNRPAWYLCALISVLTGVFVSLFVLKRKKNKVL